MNKLINSYGITRAQQLYHNNLVSSILFWTRTGYNGSEVNIKVKGHEERQRTSTHKTTMNDWTNKYWK
jgi:hypothetical protein